MPLAHVVDPALHAGVELGEGDLPGAIGRVALPEPAAGVADLDLAVVGKVRVGCRESRGLGGQ